LEKGATLIGEVTFKTNHVWHLRIYLNSHDAHGPRIDIRGSGANLAFVSNGDVELDLNGFSPVQYTFPPDDYQNHLKDELQQLVANEDINAFPDKQITQQIK
jgi:hypothetical protein